MRAGRCGNWDLRDVPPPWGDRPSIYQYIRRRLATGAKCLTNEEDPLPDGEILREVVRQGRVRGPDGGAGDEYHQGEARTAAAVFGLLKRAIRIGSAANVRKLYDAIVVTPAALHLWPFVNLVDDDETLDRERLYALAKWFVTEAADREAVRWALAMVCLVSEDEDDLLIALGRHEAFSGHAIEIAWSCAHDRDKVMWALARYVSGRVKGRAIFRLIDTQNDDIKRWMLLHGARDPMLGSFAAYHCATAGELLEALSAADIDDELLCGAGEILRKLISGKDIIEGRRSLADFADGATAVEAYLGHVSRASGSMHLFLVVEAIRGFCADPKRDWPALAARGWTPERRARIGRVAREYVAQDRWRTAALAGLASADAGEFDTAAAVAESLGIDTWENRFRRLSAGEDRWDQVMQTDEDERAERVIAHALERLPLAEIAIGPAEEVGLGPASRHHRILEKVVWELWRFPGKGLELVNAALRSPVYTNRLTAVWTLKTWEQWRSWDAGTREALEAAWEIEPDGGLRERMGQLLAGEAAG